MQSPQVMRPKFPSGYVEHPKRLLAWEQVAQELAASKHYWLISLLFLCASGALRQE